MIQVRDIRVGNVVMAGSGVLQEVVVTTMHLSMGNNGTPLFPIPITEKLLLDRCGFNAYTHDTNSVSYKGVPDSNEYFTISRKFLPSGGFMFIYGKLKIELTGLHHLQNVFYFLFGQELEIK